MRAPLPIVVAAVVVGLPLGGGGVIVASVTAMLAGATSTSAVPACASATASTATRLAAMIDAWIAATVPASPLAGIGPELVAAADPAGVDPRLLAAIAMQETRLGTLGPGPGVHNPFGLGPGLAFRDWASAIALAIGTLTAMHRNGASTIAQIGVHWAPVGAANDPAGLNDYWVGGVARAYAEMGGDPDGPVFGPTARVSAPRVRGCPAAGGTAA